MSGALIDSVFAWLLTYAMHSTLLLGLAWCVSRRETTSAFARDLIWKVALVGGVLTSLAQNQLGIRPIGTFAVSPPARNVAASSLAAPVQYRTDAPAPVSPAPRGPDATDAQRVATGESFGATGANDAAFRPTAPGNADAAPSVVNWTSVFVLGWAALAALLVLTHFGRRLILMGRLANRRAIVDGPLPAMLDALCRAVGYSSHVRLTSVNSISSPVALGLHEICVPEAVLTELEPEQQRSLLAHELAHLARRDPLWLIVATLFERVFFFQPLNRMARQALQRNAEYLCDDWAATQAGSGIPLARCLERVAEWMETSPLGVPVSGMAEQRSLLVSRIARLIAGRRSATASSQVALSTGSVLILALTTAAAPGVRSEASAPPSGAERTVMQQLAALTDRGAEAAGVDPTGAAASTTSDTDTAPSRDSSPGPQPPSLAHDATMTQLTGALSTTSVVMEQTTATSMSVSSGASKAELPEDPAVIAALIERLKDSDAGVRRAAASSLGRLKSRSAIAALAAAMGDRNREVREAVVDALSNMDDRSTVPALQRALTDESAEVRKSALHGLSEFSDDLSAGSIVPLLKDPSPEVRARAADLLGEIGDRGAADELIPLLRDSNAEVRQQALHTMGKLEMRSSAPAILPMLRDGNSDVRSAALQALGELKVAVPESETMTLLADPDPDVRSQALHYVGRNPSAAFVPVLRRLIDDPNANVREHAVEALSEIRDPAARAALKAALSSEDAKVRRAAANALGER